MKRSYFVVVFKPEYASTQAFGYSHSCQPWIRRHLGAHQHNPQRSHCPYDHQVGHPRSVDPCSDASHGWWRSGFSMSIRRLHMPRFKLSKAVAESSVLPATLWAPHHSNNSLEDLTVLALRLLEELALAGNENRSFPSNRRSITNAASGSSSSSSANAGFGANAPFLFGGIAGPDCKLQLHVGAKNQRTQLMCYQNLIHVMKTKKSLQLCFPFELGPNPKFKKLKDHNRWC